MFKYFKFLIQSTNQHGVHSPFVYNLTTKAFYNKIDKETSKKLKLALNQSKNRNSGTFKKFKLIHNIITYFNAKHLLTIAGNPNNTFTSVTNISTAYEVETIHFKNATSYFSTRHKNEQPNRQAYDIIYIGEKTLNSLNLDELNNLIKTNAHNDTAIIITNIYKSKKSYKKWLKLKNGVAYNVTIDLYYCGLLFKRDQQQKEHFCIRL